MAQKATIIKITENCFNARMLPTPLSTLLLQTVSQVRKYYHNYITPKQEQNRDQPIAK